MKQNKTPYLLNILHPCSYAIVAGHEADQVAWAQPMLMVVFYLLNSVAYRKWILLYTFL